MMIKKDEKKLKELYIEVYNLRFPSTGGNPELSKLIPEFAELCGFVIGLISSYLEGSPLRWDYVKIDEEMNKKLDKIKPQNEREKQALKYIKGYKLKLDSVIKALLKFKSRNLK